MTSEQLIPAPLSITETNDLNSKSSKSQNSLLSGASKSCLSLSSTQSLKLPEIKPVNSSRNLNNKNFYLFPGLKPSNTLSTFLRIEEERIIENKNKRATNSESIKDKLQNNKRKKKIKKGSKDKNQKYVKKLRSLPRIISPYQLIQSFK